MVTDIFQNSFTGKQTSRKISVKVINEYPTTLERRSYTSCEVFVLQNRRPTAFALRVLS